MALLDSVTDSSPGKNKFRLFLPIPIDQGICGLGSMSVQDVDKNAPDLGVPPLFEVFTSGHNFWPPTLLDCDLASVFLR